MVNIIQQSAKPQVDGWSFGLVLPTFITSFLLKVWEVRILYKSERCSGRCRFPQLFYNAYVCLIQKLPILNFLFELFIQTLVVNRPLWCIAENSQSYLYVGPRTNLCSEQHLNFFFRSLCAAVNKGNFRACYRQINQTNSKLCENWIVTVHF